ncbi:helix-turn-helix transcriptional regulator [Paenibacillus sp. JTLBN-2024]
MNQHEFSNMIGISQTTLSELEQGKYNPSLEIGNITRELTAA